MRAVYDAEGLMMTAAVSAGYLTIDIAYDIPAMAETLDYIQGRFHKCRMSKMWEPREYIARLEGGPRLCEGCRQGWQNY